MAPRGGGCLYFIMEWPGIIRSGLFLALYNQWLAGSWGDVLIRVKRCGNQGMLRIFWTMITQMNVLQGLVRCVERGAGARQRQVSPGQSPVSTIWSDPGFLSAIMSVGLNCLYKAPILKLDPTIILHLKLEVHRQTDLVKFTQTDEI